MDEIMKHFDMESEKEKAKQSEAWNNQPPQSRPHKERAFELFRFQSLVEEKTANQEMRKFSYKQTWVTGKSHCSKKDWNALNPINLSQMKVPMIHDGSFLACRIIANPIITVGTSVLIEDTKGDVEDLTFYNFITNLNNPNWVKKGEIMLVKEPYLKYGYMAKTAFIRVESPSDVLFVNETDEAMLKKANALCWYKPEQLSFDELKAKGNVQFAKRNYEEAIHFYQRALNKCQTENESGIIHSNLAAAFLHLDRFYEAHEEATKVIKENNGGGALREKLLFRLSKAAYGMRQWDKAIEYSSTIVKEFPKNIEGMEELKKAKAREREASTGEFDIQGMIEQAKRGELLMDKADYIGPIGVAEVHGKGKGLIATKKIKKGTLLLAEKAYAICTENEDIPFLMCINLLTNEVNMGHQYLCMIETVQKLKRNPQTAQNLFGLFAGNDATDRDEYCKTIKENLIDSARIERIYSYNAFLASQIMDEGENDEETFKAFVSGNLEMNQSPTGLWLMPSFANHSCLANANRVFYGDMLFLYSICDIGEGEEITIHYCNPAQTLEDRKKKLNKWGFECKCEMCVLDGNDHRMEQKRANLLQIYMDIRVKALTETPTKWFKPILDLVKKMRETYRDRAKFRIHLILPLMTLRKLYLRIGESRGESAKAIEVCKEASEALGEPLVYFHQPQINLVMAEIYAFGLNPPNIRMAKKIVREAFEMTKIRTGIKNEELFHQIYKNYPRIL